MNSVESEQLDIYRSFLRIPSISAKGKSIDEAASFARDLLESKGVRTEIMKTNGNPVVYGEYNTGAERTLLVYNHYDVQPVDPEDEWDHGPFSAEEKDGRIYARGSSDNKGTLIARIFGIKKAIDNKDLKVNLKFLYEGEEEIGSPNLADFVSRNKDLLKADAVIMEGSQVGDSGRPVVTLGVKGLLYIEITETTGKSDLHSSLAAIAPNPVWNLTAALREIYDGKRVLIPGFYDDVRKSNEKEKQLLEEYPFNEKEMLDSYYLKRFRYSGSRNLVNELFTSPTCNIDGILAGYTGEGSKTVTPRKAMAKLDFRLVPNQDPAKILDSLKGHLKNKGFEVDIRDYGLEYPVRTDPDSPLAKTMIQSAELTYGKKPVIMINTPGTQPMALFTREVGIAEGVSAIGVGDNKSRAHAPNESVRTDYFFKAIEHTWEFLKLFR